MKSRIAWVLPALWLALSGGTSFGQAVAGGQIRGTVADPSGASIAGVQITAEQTSSGFKRSVTTGADGAYVLPNLPVGLYTLQATAKGFINSLQSGFVIQVAEDVQVNVQLRLSDVSEHVEVAAAGGTWCPHA